MVILVVFITFFVILKNGVFCEMVILAFFNSINVVKNLKKPDLVARQKPPFYTTCYVMIERFNFQEFLRKFLSVYFEANQRSTLLQ